MWLIGTLVFKQCAFCSANFVCDENKSMFLSVILPRDGCIS